MNVELSHLDECVESVSFEGCDEAS